MPWLHLSRTPLAGSQTQRTRRAQGAVCLDLFMNPPVAEVPSSTPGSSVKHARIALARKDFAGARAHLQEALGLDPRNVVLIMALGDLDLNQRNYAGALASYRRAVDRTPRSAPAHAGCALALKMLRQYEEAGTEAGHALGLDPANAIALKVMARLHLDAKEIPAARKYCERALADHPTDRDALAMRQECLSARSPLGPDGLFGNFAERTRTWQELGPEHILQQLVVGVEPRRTIIRQRPLPQPMGADGLALPPVNLTMGYGAGDLDYYLKIGRQSTSA